MPWATWKEFHFNRQLFDECPDNINLDGYFQSEKYFKHMLEAWMVSIVFFVASILCLLHSFLPFMFQTTSSKMVKKIINRVDSRQGINE